MEEEEVRTEGRNAIKDLKNGGMREWDNRNQRISNSREENFVNLFIFFPRAFFFSFSVLLFIFFFLYRSSIVMSSTLVYWMQFNPHRKPLLDLGQSVHNPILVSDEKRMWKRR